MIGVYEYVNNPETLNITNTLQLDYKTLDLKLFVRFYVVLCNKERTMTALPETGTKISNCNRSDYIVTAAVHDHSHDNRVLVMVKRPNGRTSYLATYWTDDQGPNISIICKAGREVALV